MKLIISLVIVSIFQSVSARAQSCPSAEGYWLSSVPHHGAYVTQPDCNSLTISRGPGDLQSSIELNGTWQCRPRRNGDNECFRGILTEDTKQIILSFTTADAKCLKSDDWIFDGSTQLSNRGAIKCTEGKTFVYKQIYNKSR